MRLFLDTNVLASGLATRGLCEDVLREVLASHELVVSQALLDELERVLKLKFKVPKDLISDILKMIRADVPLAQPKPVANVKLKDKADIIILSSALNGKADIFVTGDKEILDLKRLGKMMIVSPRTLWHKLSE